MKKFSLLFAVGAICALTFSAASAQEYYVDANAGNDSGAGTFSAPFATVQKAADTVAPGDTVIIRSGIYYETVTLRTKGTKDKPIVFKAEEYGKDKVIITGARRDVREKTVSWHLEDAERGIYSIPLSYKVYRITADGTQVAEYKSYEGLQSYTYSLAGNLPGYKQGYYYNEDEEKLYIRLREDEKYCSKDPNQALICIPKIGVFTSVEADGKTYSGLNGSALTDESYLFGVVAENPTPAVGTPKNPKIGSAANVMIKGITFEMPPVAAVWARCSDLTVSNCWFYGCREGVRGGARAFSDPFISKNITIEHCYYTDFPIYTDAIETVMECADDMSRRWYSGDAPNALFYWHSKSGMSCNYEGGGLAVRIGENWIIRYNHFYDGLDAISSNCNFSYWYTEDGRSRQVPAKNVLIYGNKFENYFDNAIEFEDNVNGMEVCYNEFRGMMDPFSWQPLAGTPFPTNIKIHHNIVQNTPEQGWVWWYTQNYINGQPVPNKRYSALFKLGAADSNWELPWTTEFATYVNKDNKLTILDSVALEDDGMKVWNNTFIYPNMAFEENVGSLGGGKNSTSNIKFYNNLIQVVVCPEDGKFKGGFKKGQAFTSARNIYFEHNMLISGLDVANDPGSSVNTPPEAAYQNEPIDDNGGSYVDDIDKVGFADWRAGRLELREDSIARGAGVQLSFDEKNTTDLGAIPYGETWKMTAGPYAECDINADGRVSVEDIAEMGRNVGKADYNIRADLNGNGKVDSGDVEIMLRSYRESGGENR